MANVNSEPNVVPLCDILLVLLIIFMVITPVAQTGVDVKLPETQTGQSGDDNVSNKAIVLTIEKGKIVKLNQDRKDLDILETELRSLYQTKQDKTIFIRADETVPYGDVLEVIDIARGAGVEVLGVIPERYASAE